MRPNMKRGSGRCDALHFCTIRLGAGLTKSIGEICRLKMRVDISGDRLPISDRNEIIIIQKQEAIARARGLHRCCAPRTLQARLWF